MEPNLIRNQTKAIRLFAFVLATSLTCRTAEPFQTNSRQAGFLRTTIETYPESERRPILDLDAARQVADQAVGLFIWKDRSDCFSGRLRLDIRSEKQSRRDLEEMGKAYGTLGSSEFRNQAIEVSGMHPDVRDLARATSVTFYSVKTAKRSDGELFLAVRTIRMDNQQKVMNVRYLDYRGNIPPWLGPR